MSKKNKRVLLRGLEVFDAGAKGKGVARAEDGRVVFVPYAVPGDVIDVQTFKKRTSYYEGTIAELKKPSPHRIPPVCQHFGVCGGCKWQHMAYEAQLNFKQQEVVNHLQRIGKVALPEVSPILGSAETYFYRNKMEFSFSAHRWLTREEITSEEIKDNRNALGFHISGMWDKILNIEECHLQADPSNAIRNQLREFAIANNLSFFDPRGQSGLLRTLMIRTSSTGELMVLVQFFEPDASGIEQVMSYLKDHFPGITSLLYVINQKPNDTIYDQEILVYNGRDHIFEEMEGLRFKIHAKSFYQTNSAQAYELYKVARDFAGLTGNEIVYDLYTGTGTIAQFVAKNAKKVVGVEAVPEAIEDARINAKNNQITNTVFYAGDMKDVFNEAFIQANGKPDVIITDPPRDGMHARVVEQILNIAPQRVVYVSCNSATQARDLALMDAAYRVTRVQPVDMFPQTHHVENVVLLERRN